MVRKSRHTSEPSLEPVTTQLTPKALTKQEFGRRLNSMLLDRGMTQSDLSRAAKVGRDSISTYINGRTFPTPLNLQAMADALGVDKMDLLPNQMMNALDDEHAAVDLKQAAGHPGKAWLRVNRAMSFTTAVEIIKLIDAEDAQSK